MPKVTLPTLHSGQVEIWQNKSRFNVVCCGRRWGKTKMMVTIAADTALKGFQAGLFTPEWRQLAEPQTELLDILKPVTKSASKTEGVIRCTTGGVNDFWVVNDNPLAGRGRTYKVGFLDEAAFTKPDMIDIWSKSIKPTLLTTKGSFWLFSTPNGVDPDNFFYRAWHDEELGFKQFYAPTSTNPYVPLEELESLKRTEHPLVYQQEYEAKFISWANSTFFRLEYILENDQPVEPVMKCDGVYAVMDCSVKSGSEHDATAVVYYGFSKYYGHKLVVLDWEMYSIDAASLEHLAPKVIEKCEMLASTYQARSGSMGLFVEDAAGGSVLIQQARTRGWPVRALSSRLMSKGKDDRAFIVGGPVASGLCKISRYAYEKVLSWKGRSMNHFLHQVTTFRIGDKEAAKRADDLLDCFTYGVAVVLTDYSMMI